jgi:hypothetical protein
MRKDIKLYIVSHTINSVILYNSTIYKYIRYIIVSKKGVNSSKRKNYFYDFVDNFNIIDPYSLYWNFQNICLFCENILIFFFYEFR